MHTAIISFADRVVYNIKTNDMKDCILNDLYKLYGIKIIQKHYHKIDENNIKYITSNPHLCSLRSNGNPYYMYFTTYNDIPIIYFIDKKVHPGYQKPRILLVRGLFCESLYNNTLIDGEMVKTRGNKWVFLMNDVMVYEGKHLTNVVLSERLNILYNLLETKYTPDETIDVCSYKIKTYYTVCKESLMKLIDISKDLDYTCRGIYFWSYHLKFKPKLYNFNEEQIISVVRKVKDETDFQLKPSEPIQIDTNSQNDESKDNSLSYKIEETVDKIIIPIDVSTDCKTMWMSQTEYPDVYNVYDNENTMTSKKLGVALIPNLKTSKIIRNAFKNKNSVSAIKVKCKYDDKFNKWYPVAIE